MCKEKIYGYARVSTREQNEDRQIITKDKGADVVGGVFMKCFKCGKVQQGRRVHCAIQ